jgi:hypothetical protein
MLWRLDLEEEDCMGAVITGPLASRSAAIPDEPSTTSCERRDEVMAIVLSEAGATSTEAAAFIAFSGPGH